MEPTPAQNRLLSLDILHAVALFGILLVNMEAFSSVDQSFRYAGLDPYEGFSSLRLSSMIC
ncbi:MAG: hypothetical protein M3511_04165 [Deinococcota bacterium]|nr:hypothetical protein [Deinococcota bacterium]